MVVSQMHSLMELNCGYSCRCCNNQRIFRFLIERLVPIKMPDGVPPALTGSFEALVPVTIMILLTGMLSVAI